MSGKKRLCTGIRMLMDIFNDRPGNRDTIVSTCSAAQLIEKNQAARRHVVQDIRCFVHLYHKSRLTDRDIIGSSYTGKYLVYHTDTGRLSRHKTTYLRHQGN